MAPFIWQATQDELIGARRRLAEGVASNRDHAIVMAARDGALSLSAPCPAMFWLGRDGEP